VAGLFAFTLPATGQEVTAAIVGTVTDPSVAPNRDGDRYRTWNGLDRQDKRIGAYNLTRIPIGTYKLQVSVQGFQATNFQPFTLVLNQTARLDAQMKAGRDKRGPGRHADAPQHAGFWPSVYQWES